MWNVILLLVLMNAYSLHTSQTNTISQTHSLQCGIVSDHPNLAHHIPQTQKKLWILACAAQWNWAQVLCKCSSLLRDSPAQHRQQRWTSHSLHKCYSLRSEEDRDAISSLEQGCN